MAATTPYTTHPHPELALPRTMPATGAAMAALAAAVRATGRTLLQASGEAAAMGLVAPTSPRPAR